MHKRILLIGDTGEILDEGSRLITKNIYEGLIKKYQVKLIDTKELKKLKIYKEISKFKPDIIHYLPGPKLRSIVTTWILSKVNKAKTFVSTPNPTLNKIELFLGQFFQPHLLLCQSLSQQKIFNRYGFHTEFLPNGVDVKRVHPVDEKTRKHLRMKYDIPLDKFVILHIGHISKMRNVISLIKLSEIKSVYALIIAATSWHKPDKLVMDKLKNSGIDIRLDYFPEIQELYQLADCYIFPGDNSKSVKTFSNKRNSPSIEIPLTVLEAMSCNLRIMTKKYGGLVDLFEEKDGFYYYSDDTNLLLELEECMSRRKVDTREMVLQYDWNNIIENLSKFYES